MKRFIGSTNHAIAGIVHAFKNEGNMRIHFICALLAVGAGILTYVTRFEMMMLSITITFVIVAELFNTAIEAVVDMITKQYHEYARIAKNVGAGAVLMAALNSLVVGYLIFYRKLQNYTFIPQESFINLPAHTTFLCLIVVGILVIILKSYSTKKKGTYFQGGMPSGHTALAFSLFMSIALLGKDAVVTTFSCILAMLVAESRIETNVHTVTKVLVGALMGMLITVVLFELSSLLIL